MTPAPVAGEPVRRSHAEARRAYDRISRVYDVVEGPFEAHARRAGLRLLGVRAGERVLDIGSGTGTALIALGTAVGAHGLAAGIDLSAACSTSPSADCAALAWTRSSRWHEPTPPASPSASGASTPRS